MSDRGIASPASEFATALLAEFIRAGVRDIVVSPGSRSQALALAAARFEQRGLLRLHVRIDERSGSFLALGLARESGLPVLIVTTSGTAVAELHPAVLEASHAGIPLILLTADRPEELRGVGASQATIQHGMYGTAVRLALDVPAPEPGGDVAGDAQRVAAEALAAVVADNGGPVQLNLAFREPLSGNADDPDVTPGAWVPAARAVERLTVAPRLGTVVVAGDGAGPRAEEAARLLGAPLFAEVVSGAHFGPNLVPAYRELIRTEGFGDRIERVIVFGRPTLSREVPALAARPGVETIVVRGAGREDWNPTRSFPVVDELDITESPEVLAQSRSWVGPWVFASRRLLEVEDIPAASLSDDPRERAQFARDQLARVRTAVTRRMLVEAVWAATWPHDRLVVGASRLIRELDRVATGKKVVVHSNRGLAGIDGTIATATGVAIASQAAEELSNTGITRVLIGDLTVQHDLGSLLPAHGEESPRIQLVVGNDGGGSMFDLLEVAGSADPTLFDRVQFTPNSLNLEAIAAATGWEYRRVEVQGDLVPALTPGPGRTLIEVVLAR